MQLDGRETPCRKFKYLRIKVAYRTCLSLLRITIILRVCEARRIGNKAFRPTTQVIRSKIG